MSNKFVLLFVYILVIALDLYVFQAIKLTFVKRKIVAITIFWLLNSVLYSLILYAFLYTFENWHNFYRTLAGSYIFSFILFKLIVALFLIMEDVFRLFALSINATIEKSLSTHRSQIFSHIALIVASLPILTLIFGIFRNGYNYKKHYISIMHKDLHPDLIGLKIIQISDIHCGTFLQIKPIQKAIDMILSEKPDFIFFTGDLVNMASDELIPYIEIFSQLKATHGVYSVLGNHDYGDYESWENESDKQINLQKLKDYQREMNWTLLCNEHKIITINNAKLGIIGVENWSAIRRFTKYGDLTLAQKNMENTDFNIVLSHDPSHWTAEIVNQNNLHLTLSGHTHGFQFGFEFGKYKWSPVQYVYPQWAGLYTKNDQNLYVNRGFGMLGYPGRIGILPEITMLTLRNI